MENISDTKYSFDKSPRYPAIDLETAIKKIEVLYKAIGRSKAHIDAIYKHLGYKSSSGYARTALASLLNFGLLEDVGRGQDRKAFLTDISYDIILDERPNSIERQKAIKKAALKPSIHELLFNEYKGGLPDDITLKYYLQKEMKFTDTGVEQFLKQFRSTIEFAGLTKYNIDEDIHKTIKDKIEDDKVDDPDKHTVEKIKMNYMSQIDSPKTDKEISLQPYKSEEKKHRVIDFPIPLSLDSVLIIKSAFPMTEDQWDHMMALLNLHKKTIVKKESE